jgi:hypothetical protein
VVVLMYNDLINFLLGWISIVQLVPQWITLLGKVGGGRIHLLPDSVIV